MTPQLYRKEINKEKEINNLKEEMKQLKLDMMSKIEKVLEVLERKAGENDLVGMKDK